MAVVTNAQFGEWVRNRRKQKEFESNDPDRYQVSRCGRRADRDQSWWSRVESGRPENTAHQPVQRRISTLRAIAKGLEVPFEEVLMAAGYQAPGYVQVNIRTGEIAETDIHGKTVPATPETIASLAALLNNTVARFNQHLVDQEKREQDEERKID